MSKLDTLPLEVLHSDSWWERVLDGELTCAEELVWQAHLAECSVCRYELSSMMQVDTMLRTGLPAPQLSPEFKMKTVNRIDRQFRLRRWLNSIASIFLITLVTWFVLGSMNGAFDTVSRAVNALIAGREVLWGSLVRTALGLLVTWKAMLPLIVGWTLLSFLLLVPNGLMATLAVFWFSRRKLGFVTAQT